MTTRLRVSLHRNVIFQVLKGSLSVPLRCECCWWWHCRCYFAVTDADADFVIVVPTTTTLSCCWTTQAAQTHYVIPASTYHLQTTHYALCSFSFSCSLCSLSFTPTLIHIYCYSFLFMGKSSHSCTQMSRALFATTALFSKTVTRSIVIKI